MPPSRSITVDPGALTGTTPCWVYGTHLHPKMLEELRAQWQLDAHELVALGRATLHDHALSFEAGVNTPGGGFTLRPHLGSRAHGVLLGCSDRARALFDDHHGAGPSVRESVRTEVRAWLPDGRTVRATTHVAAPERQCRTIAPDAERLRLAREGLQAWGLPTRCLRKVAMGLPGVDRVSSVFVYGTLLPGESRAGVWARHTIRYAGAALAPGRMFATEGDYPAVVQGPEAGNVAGEVEGEFIRVSDIQGLLAELDAIEEYRPGVWEGQLFRRVLTDVALGGKIRKAWMYVAGDQLELHAPIASGSWRRHLGN